MLNHLIFCSCSNWVNLKEEMSCSDISNFNNGQRGRRGSCVGSSIETRPSGKSKVQTFPWTAVDADDEMSDDTHHVRNHRQADWTKERRERKEMSGASVHPKSCCGRVPRWVPSQPPTRRIGRDRWWTSDSEGRLFQGDQALGLAQVCENSSMSGNPPHSIPPGVGDT